MKPKVTIKRGTILMILGTMMILGALSLIVYNSYKDNKAGQNSQRVLNELKQMIADGMENGIDSTQMPDFTGFSESDENNSEDITQSSFDENSTDSESNTDKNNSVGTEDVEDIAEMPYSVIEGQRYIGIVDLPVLGITLPVLLDWSDELMDIAPCRYAGTLENRDLVIMAHNYANHFGRIFDLNIGDAISFTDIQGSTYYYEVTGIDVMGRSEVYKMFQGDWDLTLFTCVPQTYNRLAVRCTLLEEIE